MECSPANSPANSSETREPLECAGKCSAPRPSQRAVVALAHTDAVAAQTWDDSPVAEPFLEQRTLF